MSTMTTYGDLPALTIHAPDGAQATIALYGAHLLSWKTADGAERLFMSSRSPLDGSKAIRGGVPVIFPQFSTRGTQLRHGVARLSHWRVGGDGINAGRAWAEFELNQHDLSEAMAFDFPYKFELRLRFTVAADAIEMRFTVKNSGAEAFPFACALHTYYALGAFAGATLDGLPAGRLPFSGYLDEIHAATPTLLLRDGARQFTLEQQGFGEWVVWNPGADGAAKLDDMADDEHARFVCIEPARVDKQPLAPGDSWTGLHRIAAR